MADSKLVKLGAFDTEQFRIPAKDAQGHAERLQCRVLPGYKAQIQTIVQSRVFPYRSEGDLFRHAVVKHLHWLESIGPVQSIIGQVDAMMDLLRQEEYAAEIEDLFEVLQSVVSRYTGSDDQGQARRVILDFKKNIVKMPEGFWRDRYLKKLETDFGWILRDAPTASLKPIKKKSE